MGAAGTELDFDAMLAALGGGIAGDSERESENESANAPARGTAVLLHVCAHNPSGVDLTAAQWDALAELFARRGPKGANISVLPPTR